MSTLDMRAPMDLHPTDMSQEYRQCSVLIFGMFQIVGKILSNSIEN